MCMSLHPSWMVSARMCIIFVNTIPCIVYTCWGKQGFCQILDRIKARHLFPKDFAYRNLLGEGGGGGKGLLDLYHTKCSLNGYLLNKVLDGFHYNESVRSSFQDRRDRIECNPPSFLSCMRVCAPRSPLASLRDPLTTVLIKQTSFG